MTIQEQEQECEHGLSASLCTGPEHYPADTDEHYSTSELMAANAATYHALGQTCPWDCGRCPGTDDDMWDDKPAPWSVQTPYGQVDAQTYAEAKMVAVDAAKVTGRACKIEKRSE